MKLANKNDLTQEYLRSIFRYCNNTGMFFYSKKVSRKINLGQAAGTVKKGGNKKYIHIIIDGFVYKAHRLVWLYFHGDWPKNTIDHINGNGIDNRIENLADKSLSDNHKNKRLYITNGSGICGVFYNKNKKRFISQIRVNTRQISLKSTIDFFEACCARKSAENKYGFHENHGMERPL